MSKYLETKKGSIESAVLEAMSPAQQAAIAISKKEKGEKPKNEKVECPKCEHMFEPKDFVGATKAIIVTNSTISKACNLFINDLKLTLNLDVIVFEIDDGESYKNIDTVMQILGACLDHQMGRKDILIALGGGVVGDMAGFAASI